MLKEKKEMKKQKKGIDRKKGIICSQKRSLNFGGPSP
jgi:hypothetical protein